MSNRHHRLVRIERYRRLQRECTSLAVQAGAEQLKQCQAQHQRCQHQLHHHHLHYPQQLAAGELLIVEHLSHSRQALLQAQAQLDDSQQGYQAEQAQQAQRQQQLQQQIQRERLLGKLIEKKRQAQQQAADKQAADDCDQWGRLNARLGRLITHANG